MIALAFLAAFCGEVWDAVPGAWGKTLKAIGLGALAVKLLLTDARPPGAVRDVRVVNPASDPAKVSEV